MAVVLKFYFLKQVETSEGFAPKSFTKYIMKSYCWFESDSSQWRRFLFEDFY